MLRQLANGSRKDWADRQKTEILLSSTTGGGRRRVQTQQVSVGLRRRQGAVALNLTTGGLIREVGFISRAAARLSPQGVLSTVNGRSRAAALK